MAANRLDLPKPGGDSGKAPAGEAPATAAQSASRPASGGLAAWLPLILSIVLMPILAYATTMFVLAPKLQKALGASAAKAEGGHAKKGSGGHGGPEGAEGEAKKTNVALKKVLVNVAGTQGTRFLLANLTLVGLGEDFKANVEQNQDQLADVAASTLSSKTIADLERPGARNLIRSELLTVFNSVLGDGAVKEIYLTEFAVQ